MIYSPSHSPLNSSFYSQTPSWLICIPAVFAIVLHFFFVFGIVLLLKLFMEFNSLLSFVAYINAFWALCVSPLLAQDNLLIDDLIHLLVVVSSLIISVILLSSFILFINCSLGFHLSFVNTFLAFLQRWPIHCLACFLFCEDLHYCNNNMVSLSCGLNRSLNTLNSPVLVLHLSCSS